MSSVLGKIIADFSTSITTKISPTNTTATLLSILDDDGATIANGKYFITIDGDNSLKEHFSCTLTGKALTALKSISRKGVESSGAVREHRVGATVTMTNFAHIKFLNDLLDGTTDLDGATPLKYDADPTLVNDADLATKKYADDLAIAGSPKATEAVYGISKLSVAADSPTVPIVVGDNDPRLPSTDEKAALAGTPRTPNASNKYLNHAVVNSHIANTAGYLTGGSGATSTYATWAAITDGSFRITVDGVAYNVDAVDFSGDASMADVAATLQTALRAATSGTETVVWSTDHFVITSATSDEDSEISVTTTSTGTVGTDISGLGATAFMDCDTGNGTATQGTSQHDNLVKLDTDGKIDESFIEKDTDVTLAADSDLVIASQKAVKAYVDNHFIPQQTINYYDGNDVKYSQYGNITSNEDGSIVIVMTIDNAQNAQIYRYERDTTGMYFMTHTATLALGGVGESVCGCIIGSYLYVFGRISGVTVPRRYNLADLTGVTTFTFSGSQSGNIIAAFSDGTDVYIFYLSNQFYRYTISGTVLTNAETIAYTSADNVYGAVSDGTYVYMVDTAVGDVVRKYDFTGGSPISTFSNARMPKGHGGDSNRRLAIYKTGVILEAFAYSNYDGTTITGANFLLTPRAIQ